MARLARREMLTLLSRVTCEFYGVMSDCAYRQAADYPRQPPSIG